jgi:hypothetical protein
MGHEVGSWKMAFVNGPSSTVRGPTSMVQLHRKLGLRALGPSLGVNRMWTKKSDVTCITYLLFIVYLQPLIQL